MKKTINGRQVELVEGDCNDCVFLKGDHGCYAPDSNCDMFDSEVIIYSWKEVKDEQSGKE